MFPLSDDAPAGRFPFINLGLIAITVYVFFHELASPNLDSFIAQWSLVPSQVSFFNPPSLLPFFTSMFLHGGWLHVISNMWFLWIFGDNVEAKLGHFNYLSFYIFSGLIANLTEYFVFSSSSIPMLGASGAIAGVLGAYFVYFPKSRIQAIIPIFIFPLFIQIPAALMLLYWFFIQFFSGVTALEAPMDIGGIAWWAHIAGFAFGWVVAAFLKKTNSLSL